MSDSLGTSSGRAEVYLRLADEADGSEPTTFTSDEVYVAASRLYEVLGRQLLNADVIRGRQPRSRTPVLTGIGWLLRLVRPRRPAGRSVPVSFG
jgi:hypothetical protein